MRLTSVTAKAVWRTVAAVLVVVGCGILLIGCSRTHYRLQADAVVSDAVAGGTADPRFELPGLDIYPDPRSRLYDPTDWDRPPRPPDDPDAHRLMECVDGHRGWPHWDKDGVLDDVEVNDYRSYLPYDSDGNIPIDLRGALDMARLHSREYQQQLETMYLSAIDVTAERFAFETQFYGGNTSRWIGLGPVFPGGPLNQWSTVTNPYLTKASTTGGTLMAQILNSVVWEFSGNHTTTNVSYLNFMLSQPLLQFAGRPRVLEKLTRVERNLLYNIRQYERYRQGFYLLVATGNPSQTTLSRIGGIFGGSGLGANFSGVGVGGFGSIGNVASFAGAAAGANSAISPGQAGGYWYFLQQQQILRNVRAQNSRLRDAWLQLGASFEAGRENRFQVEFALQQYYVGQSVLLQNLVNYQTVLDIYKAQTLDIPPDMPIEIRDPTFDKFKIIDPELSQLQDEIGDRLEVISSTEIEGTKDELSKVVNNLPQRVQRFIVEVGEDLKTFEAELPARTRALKELAEFPEVKSGEVDNRALTVESLEQRIQILRRDYPRVAVELKDLAGKAERLAGDTELDSVEKLRAEKEVLSGLSAMMMELSLIQARSRLHGISLVPLRVNPTTAFQVALTQRADWMNAKASLVDSWRLIRYNANALRTNLTVNVSGQLGTTQNNPINFDASNGQLQAGVTVDPPLTRVLERNQFRQSLIDYQQQRRQLMLARDSMHQELRLRLRQLRLDQLNIELRRVAVDVAITQTDLARLKLIEPEKPVSDVKLPTGSPTAARDLVDALANLVNTQQALIFTWGDFEVNRRLLDFAMGTMKLDMDGMWIDPGAMTDDTLISRYYEGCPSPWDLGEQNGQFGFTELAPGELPPEPTELQMPVDVPSPQ